MSNPKPQRRLDWEAVWNSLNWDDDKRQQHNERERLRQRARQYAAPLVEKESAPEDAQTLLTFDLGEERYGLEVSFVRGVRGNLKVARVPGTPEFYRGVINVRGQIMSVLDLRPFLGLVVDQEVITPDEGVMIEGNHLHLALVAHQVIGLISIPTSAIRPIEYLPYAWGVTKDKVIVLNLKSILEDERLIVGETE